LFKLSIKVLTDSELVCLKLLHEAHGSKKKLPNQNKNQTKKYNNFITYLPLKEIFLQKKNKLAVLRKFHFFKFTFF